MQAFRAAYELVETPNQLRVIHILPLIEPLEPVEPELGWSTSTPMNDGDRVRLTEKVLSELLTEKGYKDISIEIRLGDPGSEITLYAEDIQAGLIVVHSHGRGAIQRMLLGSTTDRVMHLAHCPVLVLKDRSKS